MTRQFDLPEQPDDALPVEKARPRLIARADDLDASSEPPEHTNGPRGRPLT